MEQQNWFYLLNNQQVGPVSRDEITRLIAEQILTPDSYVWAEGMEDWQLIGQIPEFAAIIPAGYKPPRPQSVTVLGILNIVFGGMSLMCSPLGIIGLIMPQPNSPFQMTAGMKLFAFTGYIFGFIFAVVLLVSGIGLLKLKSWARQAAYIYGWVAIVWGILGLFVNLILFMPNLSGVSQEAMPAVIGGIIGGMCGGVLGLIYPAILVIFLRKPHVIEACNQ